jgi:chorismate synthase
MGELRWRTAGESHGSALVAIVEGLPSGLALDVPRIDGMLARRQRGYGRGRRMQIESDHVEVIAGLKRGVTLGSPVALLIRNADARIHQYRTFSRPRPGHADLAGALKYGTRDCADIMERASARETAARTAAGALVAQLLSACGIDVLACTTSIAKVALPPADLDAAALRARVEAAAFGSGAADEEAAREAVDAARAARDTLGGTFEVTATGVPAGLGSCMQWDQRLDGRLAQALMSIPGIKGVEVGVGFDAAGLSGRDCHDPILRSSHGVTRAQNRAGGIEGGMSNGAPIRLRAAMKPIPSLPQGLESIDLESGLSAPADFERSDVCSVPAASVVGEAMVALELARALLEAVPADRLLDLQELVQSKRDQQRAFLAGQGPESSGNSLTPDR